jgi:glutamate 5-kinase
VVARGLCQYGAVDVRRLAGRHSRDIDGVLGYSYGPAVVHRDDLALVREPDLTTRGF